jgi:hypothetical protein
MTLVTKQRHTPFSHYFASSIVTHNPSYNMYTNFNPTSFLAKEITYLDVHRQMRLRPDFFPPFAPSPILNRPDGRSTRLGWLGM